MVQKEWWFGLSKAPMKTNVFSLSNRGQLGRGLFQEVEVLVKNLREQIWRLWILLFHIST
jgi:hypothetical protein